MVNFPTRKFISIQQNNPVKDASKAKPDSFINKVERQVTMIKKVLIVDDIRANYRSLFDHLQDAILLTKPDVSANRIAPWIIL